MLNRQQIKANARQLTRSAAVSPLVMAALVLLITFLLDRMSDLVASGNLFASYTGNAEYMDAVMSGDFSALPDIASGGGFFSPMSLFFSVLINLFTIVLHGGFYSYCIGIRRGVQMPYTSLLDGLSVSGKLIWCAIQMTVKTFLWSMLFVFPGIIALYRYRFAYYNIMTNPALTASEAIRLSCQQTRGMKSQLFLLDLSFLGWLLLENAAANLLFWLNMNMTAILVSAAIQIWLMPYMTLSDLAYFEEGQRRVSPPSPPVWGSF